MDVLRSGRARLRLAVAAPPNHLSAGRRCERAMAVSNADVARILEERAEALTRDRANPYKVRAYRKAARAIAAFKVPVADLVAAGQDLRQVPGVGEGLAQVVKAIVEGLHRPDDRPTPGQSETADEEEDLSRPPDHEQELQVLEALRDLALDKRHIRPLVLPIVHRLAKTLAGAKGVDAVEVVGSIRRGRDTVAGVDLVAMGDGSAAIAKLRGHRDVTSVLSAGAAKASVLLGKGLHVDLRTTAAEDAGAVQAWWTGSRAHVERLRALAKDKGLAFSATGLRRDGKPVAAPTEAAFYKTLGLSVIEPELREDRGEIEAALARKLPKLVTLADLKGDLHTHTDWTDGRSPLKAMVVEAVARGLRYIAVTDHTPRTSVAGGMAWPRHQQQHKAIDAVNEALEGAGHKFRLLKGAEVDILKDGRLDLPSKALKELDVVVASLHFREGQSSNQLTARALAAMGTGDAHILGHPSGRLLDKRPPIEHDWTRLIEAAGDQGWAFETDGQPWRQDLWDTLLQQCKQAGVRVSVSSDAHSTAELAYIENSLVQARRGWLEKADVLNTRTADQLLKLLA
jgi:DNA polymerase (family 10)